MRPLQIASTLAFMAFGVLALSAGCGSKSAGDSGDGGSSPLSSSSGGNFFGTPGSSGGTGGCVNGQCPATNCPGGSTTTITGTVYDPAGKNPLPSVTVYVPAKPLPLPALPHGAQCGCQSLYTGGIVASAITGTDGTFTISNPPVGSSIPLVVQAGKWRTTTSINVTPCQANNQPKLRLPANSKEGNLPDIAISTGGADSLECLLTRIGVSDSEFVDGTSNAGHIHIYQGGVTGNGNPGPTIDSNTPLSTSLWASEATLAQYDLVLLSCEGAETGSPNPAALDAYVANDGGKVFASHFHYFWFTDTNGPFPKYNLGMWKAGTNDVGNINAVVQTTLPSGNKFAKGQIMHDWLKLVGALNSNDELPIQQSRYNVMVTSANTNSVPWIDAANDVAAPAVPGATQYFSWDEPIGGGAEKVCGRVVYSDLHVGAASGDYGNLPGATASAGASVTTNGIIPMGCNHTGSLSPQEAALEFMLFDLSSCLTPVDMTPVAPPPAQ